MYRKLILLLVLFLSCICLVRSYYVRSYPVEYEVGSFGLLSQPDDITCGPSCVAMLVNWRGGECSVCEAETYAGTRWFEWGGGYFGMTTPEGVSSSLSKLGVRNRLVRGGLGDLKHYVSRDRPPVVLVRSGDENWHYVVILGYTLGEVIYADPSGGVRRVCSVENFVSSWEFRTDMRGRVCGIGCFLCGGRGGYGWGVGCDLCGGRGKIDPLVSTCLMRCFHEPNRQQ